MTIAALIVAAGRGSRAGGPVPKQWQPIAGKPVARWTLEKFAHLDHLVLVVNPDDMQIARDACRDLPVGLVAGGADRAASVRAGLEALVESAPDLVLVHDVARPCVTRPVIDAVIAALVHAPGAAPALPVTDALWTGANGFVDGTHDRAGLWRAQTPQGFHFGPILAAHRIHPGGAPDDVAVARGAGIAVRITQGDARNLKITNPGDLARAAAILETSMDIRLGNGFDVHRFCAGDHVMLCGVRIAHEHGLDGHSDADVGMHAVTDAIYGALAMGDIGQHFPPSDPQWKGAESHVFLRHAVGLAREKGYDISNVDVTIVCEFPKVGPHAGAMKEAMARTLETGTDRVSIKATTSERLGFTGRGEGIAALATAALVRA